MTKLGKILGIVVSVVIIGLSIAVFAFNTNMLVVDLDLISAPVSEPDLAYGGDAYTGMQQAAAQAANNMIPVFEAVEDNNSAIRTMNRNLINQANFFKFGIGSILLAFGLATLVKYIGVPVVVNDTKKAAVAETVSVETECSSNTVNEHENNAE